jgi:hypothetical protein
MVPWGPKHVYWLIVKPVLLCWRKPYLAIYLWRTTGCTVWKVSCSSSNILFTQEGRTALGNLRCQCGIIGTKPLTSGKLKVPVFGLKNEASTNWRYSGVPLDYSTVKRWLSESRLSKLPIKHITATNRLEIARKLHEKQMNAILHSSLHWSSCETYQLGNEFRLLNKYLCWTVSDKLFESVDL